MPKEQQTRSMRMAELSRRSGVPIPTIRFYIREGLLSAGRLTSANQALYEDSHVSTLKLVRALVEVGGLSLQRARHILELIRAKDGQPYPVMGAVQYALTEPPPTSPVDDAQHKAEHLVDALIQSRGWDVRDENPSRAALARTIATLTRLEQEDVLGTLDAYADAAGELARREVSDLLRRTSPDELARGVIAYDVLGDALLSALRRLAQESEVTRAIARHS